jgi:manganese/zinc/iron transport system substrate-binding protein
MTDLLVELASRRRTVAVTKDIPREELLEPAQFQGKYDPHVWFDVPKWQIAARTIAAAYKQIDPGQVADYDARLRRYLREVQELDSFAKRRFGRSPAGSACS